VPLMTAPDGAASRSRAAADAHQTFAVLRRGVRASYFRGTLLVSPPDLAALVIDGQLLARDGQPLDDVDLDHDDARWVGAWHDESRGLIQHLRPEGRYSETRDGRVDAYTGRFWAHDATIAYLDDSGFWAFGEQADGVLLHADFVMTRMP
jgi:hypothetical protein